MSRVLLLNPPGTRNYIRDYFCSKLAKSNYKSPPIVLLMLSGTIASEHEVEVLDAIAENLDTAQTLHRIRAFAPEYVVALVGAASWQEDRDFLLQLKMTTSAYVIANGDIMLEDTEARLSEAPAIDAVLFNFISPDILALLKKRDGQPIPNTLYRGARHGFILGGHAPQSGDYQVPRPLHERFPLRKYRFPFMVKHPMTAMLTDYGCPFRCSFCVIPGLGFGLRPIADVLEEMEHLRGLGVREIFFLDQTFASRVGRTLELCRAMQQKKMQFQWSCFSRADVLNEEILLAMKASGCHTIIIGVESANDEILNAYNKKTNMTRIRSTLQLCRKLGIRVAATFMLGLPGETLAQAQKTIALALELPLDFVAFNVAIPRAGTQLRSQAIHEGLIDRELHTMDQSGMDEQVMRTKELSAEQIMQLRRQAIRSFYLRPGYLFHRLISIRSFWDLWTQVVDGSGVVLDALGWGSKT